jgi:hypothetical protein
VIGGDLVVWGLTFLWLAGLGLLVAAMWGGHQRDFALWERELAAADRTAAGAEAASRAGPVRKDTRAG